MDLDGALLEDQHETLEADLAVKCERDRRDRVCNEVAGAAAAEMEGLRDGLEAEVEDTEADVVRQAEKGLASRDFSASLRSLCSFASLSPSCLLMIVLSSAAMGSTFAISVAIWVRTESNCAMLLMYITLCYEESVGCRPGVFGVHLPCRRWPACKRWHQLIFGVVESIVAIDALSGKV